VPTRFRIPDFTNHRIWDNIYKRARRERSVGDLRDDTTTGRLSAAYLFDRIFPETEGSIVAWNFYLQAVENLGLFSQRMRRWRWPPPQALPDAQDDL
jgi:hypothetical protein